MSSPTQGSPNRRPLTVLRVIVKGERGAALLMMLLFLTLSIIFVLTMLATTGDEVVIAGFHRDGVLTLDLAQAGIQEGVRRLEAGRPYTPGFTSSMNPGVTVTVTRKLVGTNSAYLEIQSTATVGRATRRLSDLVLQYANLFPPNVLLGPGITAEAEKILTGDIYAETYVNYLSPFIDPSNKWTYAGWRITMQALGPCYTHTACVALGDPQAANWYPGLRQMVSQTTGLGADIAAQTTKCPAGGGGSLPPDVVSGVFATDNCTPSCTPVTNSPAYGFDIDNPGVGPQAVTSALPCGLPYKYVSKTFKGEDGVTNYTRLFKTIVTDQWLANYWQFDAQQMILVKKSNLVTYPQLGGVPLVDLSTITPASSYDRVLTGGGTLTTGDFGCKYPEMGCTPPVDRPISVLLNGGNWTLGSGWQGHGTLVVNGNLTFSGPITFWGTIIVSGNLETGLGTPPNTVYGGVVANTPWIVHDAMRAYAGGNVTSVPVGPSRVLGKAWWER
jgi:hypothetical protein